MAVVQARMGSSRLPGKVLHPLAGRPMVAHVLDRTKRIQNVDGVVLATTLAPRDDVLVEIAQREGGVEVFRGAEEDVLSRYVEAARQFDVDAVVRVTADCPLLSPDVSGRVVQAFLEGPPCEYCSNTLNRSFPRGLDTEVVSRAALEQAHRGEATPTEREHVTLFIIRRPSLFTLRNVGDEIDRSHHRWTVDVHEDLELVRRIYSELYRPGGVFEYAEVLSLLETNPDWSALNQHVRQKAAPS